MFFFVGGGGGGGRGGSDGRGRRDGRIAWIRARVCCRWVYDSAAIVLGDFFHTQITFHDQDHDKRTRSQNGNTSCHGIHQLVAKVKDRLKNNHGVSVVNCFVGGEAVSLNCFFPFIMTGEGGTSAELVPPAELTMPLASSQRLLAILSQINYFYKTT